jgi:hypothetical protein
VTLQSTRRHDDTMPTDRTPATPTGPLHRRDPARSLVGCERVLVLGRTGSGKTTLARELSAALGVPHVELDSLYFDDDLATVPLAVLRQRTGEAVGAERWVTDGNKSSVRDIVWPRADTVVWLDYPLAVCLWRLGRRALWRTSMVRERAGADGADARSASAPTQLYRAARGVLKALRSHAGQRRRYPRLFASPAYEHLALVRLRTPRATTRWLAQVTERAGVRSR